MNTEPTTDVKTLLHALAVSSQRSFTTRIADLLEDIEDALSSGAKRKAVHQALVQSGIQVSFEGFRTALYRLRKQRVRMGPDGGHTPAHQMPASSPAVQADTPRVQNSAPAASPAKVKARDASPAQSHGTRDPYAGAMRPGRIAEIARDQPNMAALAAKGREYAAKLDKEDAEARALKSRNNKDTASP